MSEIEQLYKLACLSSAIYSNPPEFEQLVGILIPDIEAIEFFENPETDTQAAIVVSNLKTYVMFRGTEADKIKDWFVDLDVELIPTTHGSTHAGFTKALESVFRSLFDALLNYSSLYPENAIEITGHSLGGALASLFAYECSTVGIECDLVTFGAPQVGDGEWSDYMARIFMSRHKSVVNNNDIVPTLPPLDVISGYCDAGVLHLLTEDGDLVVDPSTWARFIDRLDGRLEDLFELGTDGIKDHSLENDGEGYIPTLSKLFDKEKRSRDD